MRALRRPGPFGELLLHHQLHPCGCSGAKPSVDTLPVCVSRLRITRQLLLKKEKQSRKDAIVVVGTMAAEGTVIKSDLKEQRCAVP